MKNKALISLNRKTRAAWFFAFCAAILLFTACAPPRLMKTPNLYLPKDSRPFDAVPEALQTGYIPVVFATDRFPIQKGANKPVGYGAQRSNHLYVGTCRVNVGKNMTWEKLVKVSTSPGRGSAENLSINEPSVKLRYPGSYWRAARIDDPSHDYEEFQENRMRAREGLYDMLRPMLAKTPKKQIFLYVHGYNNTFADALETTAEIWHFTGREGVPIAYTWPAGAGGLTGYTTDSESGEFSVYHLKMFLEDLAADPDIERINILAHSRGTDVTLTALRELIIGIRGAGKDPHEVLKLNTLILASADIDMEVAGQRISSERIPAATNQMALYISTSDKALKLSSWAHSSFARLGFFDVGTMTPEQSEAVASIANLSLINVSVTKTDWLGHSYFHKDPAVSSDLVLLLRDGKPPGPDNGRPLEKVSDGVWRLKDGYPLVEKGFFEKLNDSVKGRPPELKPEAKQ